MLYKIINRIRLNMKNNGEEDISDPHSFYSGNHIVKLWEQYLKKSVNAELKFYLDSERTLASIFNGMAQIHEVALVLESNDSPYLNKDDHSITLCGEVDNVDWTVDDINDIKAINSIKKKLCDSIKQIKSYNTKYKNTKIKNHLIIFPYHANAIHWNLGKIQLLFAEDSSIKEAYIDIYEPLGGEVTSYDKLIKDINSLDDFQSIKIKKRKTEQIKQQHDGSSCGPITAENGKEFLKKTNGSNLLEKVYRPQEAQELRKKHIKEFINIYKHLDNKDPEKSENMDQISDDPPPKTPKNGKNEKNEKKKNEPDIIIPRFKDNNDDTLNALLKIIQKPENVGIKKVVVDDPPKSPETPGCYPPKPIIKFEKFKDNKDDTLNALLKIIQKLENDSIKKGKSSIKMYKMLIQVFNQLKSMSIDLKEVVRRLNDSINNKPSNYQQNTKQPHSFNLKKGLYNQPPPPQPNNSLIPNNHIFTGQKNRIRELFLENFKQIFIFNSILIILSILFSSNEFF